MIRLNVADLIRRYFESKREELLAASNQAIGEHPGLKGSHREELVRIYLKDIIPSRFEIGRGMIYGPFGKSKEADVVIWDSQNYPKLAMHGHSLFFADSVRIMLEVKSNYSVDNMRDILTKCKAAKDITTLTGMNLEDRLFMVEQSLNAFRQGRSFEGILIAKPRIASGAVIFRGGTSFEPGKIHRDLLADIDDSWPDILRLLEAGKLVLKQYLPNLQGGIDTFLDFRDVGENSLLVFTASLLGLLNERTVNVEEPFYLNKYIIPILEGVSGEQLPFTPTRPHAGRRVI